jgi:hypothetical protein
VQDRKRYLVINFLDASSATDARLLVKFWFDLSTAERDIVRRQSYGANGEQETDVLYSGYESLGDTLRYPSKVDIHLYDTDTLIKIDLDPRQAEFNTEIPDDKFRLVHPTPRSIDSNHSTPVRYRNNDEYTNYPWLASRRVLCVPASAYSPLPLK